MNYQPRSTNPYIMEKKLNECVGSGGLDPSVLEEIEAEISVLGSENATMAQDIIDIKGSLNSISDNLALKQPLSNILTMLVNSEIKHYKVTRHIADVSALRSYLVDTTIGDGIEISSLKTPDGRQSGFMITSAISSTYYAGVFFGYYFDDFVYFTRAGETNTIKIYKFTKTLQS